MTSRASRATLAGPQGAAFSVAFSPDGTTLASGNSDDPAHLWQLGRRFRRGANILSGDTDVISVAFSPDCTTLASGNCAKTVRLWDVATRTCMATLTGHGGWVHSVAFSPDSATLANSGDCNVRVWDTSSRTCIAILTGHSEIVREIAFSPDGTILASSSHDKTIRLWRLRK